MYCMNLRKGRDCGKQRRQEEVMAVTVWCIGWDVEWCHRRPTADCVSFFTGKIDSVHVFTSRCCCTTLLTVRHWRLKPDLARGNYQWGCNHTEQDMPALPSPTWLVKEVIIIYIVTLRYNKSDYWLLSIRVQASSCPPTAEEEERVG